MNDEFPQSRRAAVTRQADDLERLPPHSIEAEQGVLGCCLLEPANYLSAARAKLGVGAAFYELRHQTLWLALCALEDARIGIDLITVRQHLKDAGTLEQLGGVSYLTSLPDATPSAANLPFYLDIVTEKHLQRQMVTTFTQAVGQIYADGEKDTGTLFAKVEDDVRRLADAFSGESGERSIKEIVLGTLNIVETTMEHRGKGLQDPNTIPTPWNHLNKLMGGGLHKGEMIVVAARPGMGKTSLAADILMHSAFEQKRKVKFYSLEMQDNSIALRMMCAMAQCEFMSVMQGFVSEQALRGLLAAGAKMAESGLAIEARSLNEVQIRADARQAVRKGCELIVVDYLQIVPPSDRRIAGDMLVRATMVSEAMKAMAKELNVPVIVLSQLSRDIEKNGRRGGEDELFSRAPNPSDLRNSGSIEQDADAILMLWKMPEPARTSDKGQKEWEAWSDYRERRTPPFYRPTNIRIAKQRNGPAEMDVNMVFEKNSMTFHDFYGGTGRSSGTGKVMQSEMETD